MNLKEFSEAVGVSPTTISRSLSRRGRVSDETRRRVLQQMDELGYRPNLHAQHLVSGRAQMVALDFKHTPFLKGAFSIELMRGIADALQAHSYGLLLSAQGHNALSHWTASRAVDGVIVIGGEEGNEQLAQEVTSMGVTCVVIGTKPFRGIPNAASVHIDLEHGVRQVVQHLVEMGHTSIGFINSSWVDSVLPVFQQELQSYGLQLLNKHMIVTGDSASDGEAAAIKLLSLPQRPTAIFTRTDELAVGALRAAHKMNVIVPEQLSIVGHDDVPYAQLTDPLLSTVRVPFFDVGELASKMLMQLLNSEVELIEPESVHTNLITRETVCRLSPGKKTGRKRHAL